ncbi:MAG: ISNCY family transposase, partial [Candidatus Thermoplasmatota archaeon]|nr:ISNCY family transposase [Candidatus Thermoplasmatota archaeon]
HPMKERDWRTYEQQFSHRIKTAIKELDPLVKEAVSVIHIHHGPGHPFDLSLENRVKLLLIKQLVGESNRMFSNMLTIFSMLSGIDVSYKSVERLYSDQEVILAIHNLHTLILRNKGIESSNATGDGTGYSLTIKKNYESYAQRLKDKAKENSGSKEGKRSSGRRRIFAYSFFIMDLKTRMYIAYGSSMKSERDAYDRALAMLRTDGIVLDSLRLDRYYSYPSYVDDFKGTKMFLIPRRNATLNGSVEWKSMVKEFLLDTVPYLEQYHLRSNSESGFAADKKMLGQNVAQRRDDRIDSAIFCTGLWHNLFNIGRS